MRDLTKEEVKQLLMNFEIPEGISKGLKLFLEQEQ
jgi:hypothetical protein